MKKNTIAIKIETIKKIIGSLLLFLIFNLMVGHSVNTSWIQQIIPNGTILILISSIIIYLFFSCKSNNQLNFKISFSFFLIFIIALIFSIINGTTDEIIRIIYIFISFILICKSSLNYSAVVKIGLVIFISILYSIKGYRTLEINSLAIIISFGIICFLNFLDFNLKKNKLLFFLIFSIISLLFISLTRMRGSILALTVVYLYTFLSEINNNKKRLILLFLVPVIIFVFWNSLSGFFENYLFVNKWGGSDITAGRTHIWNYIINNSGFFGNGYYYIDKYAHAHNTLMHLIGRYGFIFLPVFTYFIYTIINTIFKISLNDSFKKSCFRILLLWCVFSLTETVDLIKVPLYIPQFILLLYIVLLNYKENVYEIKK